MRRHLLVVSEKKIKMLKSAFGTTKRQVLQVAPPYLFAHKLRTTNICMKLGLIIFNTLAVMLRTDDAGRRTLDAGRRTHDIVPPLPYTISSQVS